MDVKVAYEIKFKYFKYLILFILNNYMKTNYIAHWTKWKIFFLDYFHWDQLSPKHLAPPSKQMNSVETSSIDSKCVNRQKVRVQVELRGWFLIEKYMFESSSVKSQVCLIQFEWVTSLIETINQSRNTNLNAL